MRDQQAKNSPFDTDPEQAAATVALEKVLRVTCTDLVTGESETTEIPAGEYLLLTTGPCFLAGTQAYPAKGRHVLTIKGRTAP